MENNPFDIYTDAYENWFEENEHVFQSELLALKQVVPKGKKGLEIGVGSGIFAEILKIEYGIDPSKNMLKYARQRNIKVVQGYAEELPYPDKSFDFVVFITSICFINNPAKALEEAYRVLRNNGNIIIAFIDKDSPPGRIMSGNKQKSKFYQSAHFYSVAEISSLMESNNFEVNQIFQTVTDLKIKQIEQATEGYGKGCFVVIKGIKK